MEKYIQGFLKNLFNRAVPPYALVDSTSSVSKKSKLSRFTKVRHSTIDDYCNIGANTNISYVHMGKFCSVAGKCDIGLPPHNLNLLSTSPIFSEAKNCIGISWIQENVNEAKMQYIEMGNDVWIGQKVSIRDGIKVGDGAVIGAGAMVTKDIPPYAIVAGIPAKIIRYRYPEDVIKKLLEIKWWNWSEEKLKKHITLFQKDNIDLSDIESL